MDSDPHSFGSGSRGIKWREKQRLTNKFWGFFCRKLYFFKSETKKVAYLKGLGTDLKILFSWLLKMGWNQMSDFYCPGAGAGSGST